MGAPPQIGQKAPDFKAVDTQGNTIQLSQLVKKGPVILAFFPKAFTPGWRSELSAFQAGFAKLKENKGTIIAIATDDNKTMAAFRKSLNAQFPFVADTEGKLVTLYDVKFPLFTYAKRWTFIIDSKQVVVKIDTGIDAINASAAIHSACQLTP